MARCWCWLRMMPSLGESTGNSELDFIRQITALCRGVFGSLSWFFFRCDISRLCQLRLRGCPTRGIVTLTCDLLAKIVAAPHVVRRADSRSHNKRGPMPCAARCINPVICCVLRATALMLPITEGIMVVLP